MARYFIYAFKKATVAIEGEFKGHFLLLDTWQDDVELEFRARLWFETDDVTDASRLIRLSNMCAFVGDYESAEKFWSQVGFYRLECCSFNGLHDNGNPFEWQADEIGFQIGDNKYSWDSLDFSGDQITGVPYIYDEKGDLVNA